MYLAPPGREHSDVLPVASPDKGGGSRGGGGGEEKRSGTEKRCSHNLQGAHHGQRRICDLTAGLFSEVE